MSDQLVNDAFGLLAICALMPSFTGAHLRRLTSVDPGTIERLLLSDQVQELPNRPGWYRLSDAAMQEVIGQDWHERPDDQIALHAHIVRSLAAWPEWQSDDRDPADEDRFIYHFDALFFLLATKMDWRALREYVTIAQGKSIRQRRHRQRIAFFDGYIAIRTQDYTYGEPLLTDLIAQDDLEPDLRLKAWRGLALAAFFRTRFDQALKLHRQIQAYARAIGDRTYQALALLDLTITYIELEEYRTALLYCLQSLRIFRALHDWAREVSARYHASLCSMYLGRWKHAEKYSAQATQLYEQRGMHAHLGFIYWQRGYLQHILGDEAASEAFYLQALSIAEMQRDSQVNLAADIHLSFGFLCSTLERYNEALQHYDFALALTTQIDQQHRRCQVFYRRAQALQHQGRLDEAYAAYAQAIDGIEALGGATEGEDVKISLFGTTQQIYEAMVLLCLDLGRIADAFHFVERARSRAFLDTLVKKSPELYDALAQPVVTLAEVQAQLPEGALLLEYFTTGVLPSGEHMLNSIPESNARLREHLTLPPQVILFAITRERCEIDRPALNPNSLRPPVGDRYPGRHLLHGRLPQHLYDRLIAPAPELLAGCHILYLVPHGPLHYVPFTALCSAAGEYLLHANGPALAHAPSATILLRNCIGRPTARGTATLALGFNDPQGDQPLRYAEAEAQHVARILGGDAWIGMDPKSERLIAAGSSIRWLHIAGHARFNPTDPLGSELYLGSGDALSARAIIRDLDLAADLVTLSSCTSGVSHVVPGDELLGLQRALLYAGAPTVLCTRWEARDLVSLLVMDLFYTALQQGRPPGLALRDAQIAVRELTGQELAALIERWDAPDRLTLGAPAEALRDAQSATRELAGLDLGAIRDMWRGEAPDLVAALDQPAVLPSTLDSRPFADPLFWAPFMLVGRA